MSAIKRQRAIAFNRSRSTIWKPAPGRCRALASGIVFLSALLTGSAALGQNCVLPTPFVGNLAAIGSSPASISSMLSSVITTANTAFQLQSTTFVGGESGNEQDQHGAGIWYRAVAGTNHEESNTKTLAAFTPLFGGASTNLSCSQKVDENFAGVQLGSDLARLNLNNWDLYLGWTAGDLWSKGSLAEGAFAYTDPVTGLPAGGGPFTNTTEAPFFGLYAAATKDRFFIDAMLRAQYYQTTLNAPGANVFERPIDAHGFSFASSFGYNWQIPNSNWFLEPSAAIIISRTWTDPFNFVSSGTVLGGGSTIFPETITLNVIDSEIGRVGVRFGTAINTGKVLWQPFGAVSVWHEFGPNITSNAFDLPGFVGPPPAPIASLVTASSSTSTVGTFEQYSLGVSALLAGTGLIGFARVDFRSGPDLQGVDGSIGMRYQFAPAIVNPPSDAAVQKRPPPAQATDWTGFYVGGFGGANGGIANWKYLGGEANPNPAGYVAGGNAGYNYQFGQWLAGAEIGLEKIGTSGGDGCNPFGTSISNMANITCSVSANWLTTVAARAGYVSDRLLVYLKGGAAWTNEKFGASCNDPALAPSMTVQCTDPSGSLLTGAAVATKETGWLAGFGTEYAFTANWSARGEYEYIQFPDRNLVATDVVNPGLHIPIDVGMHFSEVHIGFDYHFAPTSRN